MTEDRESNEVLPPVFGRWIGRALTHGAVVVGGLISVLYIFLRRSNGVLLSHYGLSPSAFASNTTDLVVDSLPTIGIVLVAIVLLSIATRRPLRFVSNWAESPRAMGGLHRWLTANPATQTVKAISVASALAIIGVLWAAFWAGTFVGSWQISSINWIVSANKCNRLCYSYTVEGVDKPIVGLPIVFDTDRIAVVTAKDKVTLIQNEKALAVSAYVPAQSSPMTNAPLHLRLAWTFLDILNGNWRGPTL